MITVTAPESITCPLDPFGVLCRHSADSFQTL